MLLNRTAAALGDERKSFTGELFKALNEHRTALWHGQLKKKINWELYDYGMESYTWFALQELAKSALVKDNAAQGEEHWRPFGGVPHGTECARFSEEAITVQLRKDHDQKAFQPFVALRE